jgi:pimeloyl-ACP methyl ester carboxylesterase
MPASPQQRAPRRSGTLSANGVDLWYEVWGAGPPLLLMEGMAVGTWLWERQIPFLEDHFTTIAYDLRGSGKSAKPPGPYTVGQMAEDAAALLTALGFQRVDVLGASQGGFIAQEFTLRWPERVRRLVLVCTSAGGATHVPMTPATLARFLETGGAPRELIRKKLALAYTEAFLRGPEVEHLIDLRLRDPQPPHAFQAQVMAGATFDRSGDVEKIRASTLVLAGEADLVVPVENARRLAAAIPGARLRTWPGLGHQFFVEAAAEFNAEVTTFLQEEPR